MSVISEFGGHCSRVGIGLQLTVVVAHIRFVVKLYLHIHYTRVISRNLQEVWVKRKRRFARIYHGGINQQTITRVCENRNLPFVIYFSEMRY